MWCQWGREGERDQMFLKKQDLIRKKKQNLLLIRSTYSSLVFIQKKNFRNVLQKFRWLRKRYVQKAFIHLLYLRKITTKTGSKEWNRIHSFLTNP